MIKKYPKTPHLPWSNCIDEDDLVLPDIDIFQGKQVMVSEKLDGENITITQNECYLQYRQLNPKHDMQLLSEVADIQKKLKDGCILHGEYVLFQHCIHYDLLPSCLVIYLVEYQGKILRWEMSKKLLDELDTCYINPLYQGIFDIEYIKNLSIQCNTNPKMEGFVLRIDRDFDLVDFRFNIAKYVREGFQQIRVRECYNRACNTIIKIKEEDINDSY